MRLTMPILATALAFTSAPIQAQSVDREALQSSADALLRHAVEELGIPGVVAIAADAEGILYEGAFGARSPDGAPMSTGTVMDIASMTKPIAAVAVMQLVESGELDLDAPAAQYVAEIGELRVLDGWDGDTPILREPTRPITLRHLLTHTAGMGYGIWSDDTQRYNDLEGIPSVSSGDPEALMGALMNDPGEAWLYGTSIDWASRIVEEVGGQPFGEHVDRRILTPLGMDDTGFLISPRMRERLAVVHQRDEGGAFAPTDREQRQDPPVDSGGGGLYSTAQDYIRIVRLFLNEGTLDGATLLEPETVETMGQNAMGEVRVVALETNAPGFTADLEMFPEVEKSWGLSFMINETPTPTGRAAGSLAWAGINNTFFWIDPESGVGGVVMTQTLPFLDPDVRDVYLDFERAVYGALR